MIVWQFVDILNIVVTLMLLIDPGLGPQSHNAASSHHNLTAAGNNSADNLSTINNASSHASRKSVSHSSKWRKYVTTF